MINLFKVDTNGSLREWSIWTTGSQVHVESGLIDGAKVPNVYRATPKNIGRANETSGPEQAKLEMMSEIDKKKRLGYYETVEEAEENAKKFKVMKVHKALEFEDGGERWTKHYENLPDRVLWSPKIDGVNATVYFDGNKVVVMSRGNKPFEVLEQTELYAQMSSALNEEGVFINGELWTDGLHETEIAGGIKRNKPNEITNALVFKAFDVYFEDDRNEWKYTDRMAYIAKLFHSSTLSKLSVVPVFKVKKDRALIYSAMTRVTVQGGEGIIIRDPECTYQCGKRSSQVLKVKPFDTDDYKILDVVRGAKGAVMLKVNFNGEPFTVPFSGYSEDDLENLYAARKDYIGLWASVRSQDNTVKGFPKFARVYEIFDGDIKGH